mmetsp:Transcript_66439/g.131018  ORF Transcript_66439/g.131018 Transcript_66439/m.131018 type:complete len:111 (+) Transcript_66439:181-513(+)
MRWRRLMGRNGETRMRTAEVMLKRTWATVSNRSAVVLQKKTTVAVTAVVAMKAAAAIAAAVADVAAAAAVGSQKMAKGCFVAYLRCQRKCHGRSQKLQKPQWCAPTQKVS